MDDQQKWTTRLEWGRVLSGLLVLGALALMVSALGVGAGGPPWADEGETADGYPQRVERPYVVRDLPARPGPVAGLVRDGLTWLAVSPHGRLWELSDVLDDHRVRPALSADGRVLAYVRESADGIGELVFRDLVSGVVTALPHVSSGDSGSESEFVVGDHQPVFLSPDGESVLVQGGRRGGRDADALLIDRSGVRELFVPGGMYPAGWAPDGRIAWLAHAGDDSEPTGTAEIIATTESGEELGRVRVELAEPMLLSQWTPSLSPDGLHLALTGETGETDGAGVVARVSLPDQEEVSRTDVTAALDCAPAWRDDEALLTDPDHALADLDGAPVVVADPSLEIDCSIWATDALAGDQHRGLTGQVFGTSTSWLSWRWREVTAGVLLLLAATGFLAVGRPRRGEIEDDRAEVSPTDT